MVGFGLEIELGLGVEAQLRLVRLSPVEFKSNRS